MTGMPLRPVLTILIGALAAYSGYWYYMSQNAEDYLRDRARIWSRSGLDLEFDKAEVAGFPYRLVITLSKPKITYTNGLVAFQVLPDDLSIVVQPWQFDHALIFASQGSLRFGKGRCLRNAERYEFSDLSASARMLDARLSNLSIEAEELRLTTRNQVIAMVTVQFHWRAAEPTAGSDGGLLEPPIAEIAFSAGQMLSVDKEKRTGIFKNLSVRMTPRGPANLSLTVGNLAQWRDGGGTLEIDALRADWPDGVVVASGSITLDEEMRPLGLMSLDIVNARAFASRLSSTGFLEESTLAAIRNGLQSEASQSASDDLTFSLSWQAGHAYLGSFEIATLDPIFDK